MLALSLDGLDVFSREIKSLRRLLPARPALRSIPGWLDQASARVKADVPVVEAVLSRLDPTLSLRRILARVIDVRDETHDVKTFVLKPNARFGAYRPGAYVTVHVTVGGRSVQRAYSLSSPPGSDGLITITVKRVPGGLVSNHLADTVSKGDVLELGAPDGQFVFSSQAGAPVLMISAGSGITPVMSMLRQLVRSGSKSEITFLHFARSPEDVIFGRELEAIAERTAHVKVVVCVEDADDSWTGLRGRFSRNLLEAVLPDFASTDTYLCGPSGFMRVVMQALEQSGQLAKLRYERFNSEFDASAFLEKAQVVRFLKSGVEALSTRPLTVLQEAESRGVRVDTGCRAGTCGTCRCKKRKGVVMNTATGVLSGDGEEMIYPCVSVAQGAVEVEL